jgi:hypothetical protein
MGEEREARGLDDLNLTPSTAEPSLLIELIEPSFFFFWGASYPNPIIATILFLDASHGLQSSTSAPAFSFHIISKFYSNKN